MTLAVGVDFRTVTKAHTMSFFVNDPVVPFIFVLSRFQT